MWVLKFEPRFFLFLFLKSRQCSNHWAISSTPIKFFKPSDGTWRPIPRVDLQPPHAPTYSWEWVSTYPRSTVRAGGRAQQLWVVPSICVGLLTTACNSIPRGSGAFCLCRHLHSGAHSLMQTHTYINNANYNLKEGGLAQWVKALASKPEELPLTSRTHLVEEKK